MHGTSESNGVRHDLRQLSCLHIRRIGPESGSDAKRVATEYVFDGLNVVQDKPRAGTQTCCLCLVSVNQTMALTIAPQLLANLSLAPGQPSGSNMAQALWGPGLNSYLVPSDSGGTWTMLRDGL